MFIEEGAGGRAVAVFNSSNVTDWDRVDTTEAVLDCGHAAGPDGAILIVGGSGASSILINNVVR
jgi:hypothetical protein